MVRGRFEGQKKGVVGTPAADAAQPKSAHFISIDIEGKYQKGVYNEPYG